MSSRSDERSSSSKRKRDEGRHRSRSSERDKDGHRSSRRDRDEDRRDRKRRSRDRSRDRSRERDGRRKEEKRQKSDDGDHHRERKAEENGSKSLPQPATSIPIAPALVTPVSPVVSPLASTPAPSVVPTPAVAAAPAAAEAAKPKAVLPGLNLDALRAMKEKLKMEVQKKAQEHKEGIRPPPAPAPATRPAAPAASVVPKAPGTADKLAEIQSKINAKLAALQGRLGATAVVPTASLPPSAVSTSGGSGPRPLRLDEQGREVDEYGRVVSSGRVPVVATLAINKRVQREELFKLESPAVETDPTKNPYFDPRMRAPKVGRPRRDFNFVEAGTYVRKAQRMRTKLAKELLENSVGAADGEGMDLGLPRDKSLLPLGGLRKEAEQIIQKEDEPVPDVEWWDAPLLVHKERYGDERTTDEVDAQRAAEAEGDAMTVVATPADEEQAKTKEGIPATAAAVTSNINERRITHLVEHPVLLAPPTEKPPPGPMPLKLTKAEQKKMRRRARAERQREQQERVLLGLEPPPKNRMKISNMMKVLTSEAVQDPTQIEKMVRAEMEERAKAHDARNQERKLTPEQRRLKKIKKLKEDISLITHVALFRVTNLSDERHKYKVDINAQENFLTGCALLYRGCCLVLVEGGPKGIERYKKLMLRRIDWNDYTKAEAEGEEGAEGAAALPPAKEEKPKGQQALNQCDLVWEGTVLKAAFKNFQVDLFPAEKDARKFLKQRGVPHYWDACRAFRRELAPVNHSVKAIIAGGTGVATTSS